MRSRSTTGTGTGTGTTRIINTSTTPSPVPIAIGTRRSFTGIRIIPTFITDTATATLPDAPGTRVRAGAVGSGLKGIDFTGELSRGIACGSGSGEARMRVRGATEAGRLAGLAAMIAGGVAVGGGARADEPVFSDFPVVVYCEYMGTTRAYYFSQLADGQAVYLAMDRQAGVITIDGTPRRAGGEQSGSCADKTLDDLRSSGQAFDLPG